MFGLNAFLVEVFRLFALVVLRLYSFLFVLDGTYLSVILIITMLIKIII